MNIIRLTELPPAPFEPSHNKCVYLASMIWPGALEPVCVGTNKKQVIREALRILREEHGTGPVDRPAAGCSAKITASDIDISRIPYFTKETTV